MIREQSKEYDSLLDEASAWIARLRCDSVSAADKRRFSQWLNRSQQHEKAFDEVLDTWEDLGAAAFLPLEVGEIEPDRQRHSVLFNWFSNLGALGRGAAFASLCGVALLAYNLITGAPQITYNDTFATQTGQQQRVELPDGSVLELNTQSTVEVVYTEGERKLSLLAGEAYFDVAPNRQRPFVVSVQQGTVEAVGTAFNIYIRDRETLVSVTEGVVNVREKRDASNPSPQHRRVQSAQQVRLDRRGLGQVSRFDLETAVAWREKTLILDDMPLPAAIGELNRYLQRPVDAGHESLAGLRVSGTFSLEAPEATLQALITSFNLSTTQSAPEDPLYLRFE